MVGCQGLELSHVRFPGARWSFFPTTDNRQPISRQPATKFRPQISNNQQPTTNNLIPTTNNQQLNGAA
jgi:hypothetical protein